jgi:hypothetical protein
MMQVAVLPADLQAVVAAAVLLARVALYFQISI